MSNDIRVFNNLMVYMQIKNKNWEIFCANSFVVVITFTTYRIVVELGYYIGSIKQEERSALSQLHASTYVKKAI